MDETYKNVEEEFHPQSAKSSEDIQLTGIFLISCMRKSYQLIS